MSMFNIGKSCVFSAVSGVVTLDGKPVANAQINRQAKWQKSGSDQTQTDASGNFSFPPMYQSSIMKFMPAEFVTHQTIHIVHDGKEYLAWESTKRAPEENSELGGKPIKMTCELSKEPEVVLVGRTAIDGVCSLEGVD